MARATAQVRSKVKKKAVKFQPKHNGSGGIFTAKVATIVQKKRESNG